MGPARRRGCASSIGKKFDDWGAPISGQRIVDYDDHGFLVFKRRATAATGVFRQDEAPAHARMPKISAAQAIHYAQPQRRSLVRRHLPTELATRRRGAVRKCPPDRGSTSHNKAPRCTFEWLHMPTNGALTVSATARSLTATHCNYLRSSTLDLLAHELLTRSQSASQR